VLEVEVCWRWRCVGGGDVLEVEVCWRRRCVGGGGVLAVTQTVCIPPGGLQGRRVADEEHGPSERQRGHAAPPVHRQVCL